MLFTVPTLPKSDFYVEKLHLVNANSNVFSPNFYLVACVRRLNKPREFVDSKS